VDQRIPQIPQDAAGQASLAVRLRRRRRQLGLTLKDVASGAGLSVGFISQIERGIATPSLSSLASVARVLASDVGEFLAQPRGEKPLTRHDQREVYTVGDKSMSYERLSAAFPGNVLRSVLIHESPGHRSEPISHEGEEIFYILDGAITVEVDGEPTVLEAGDSIHFPSNLRHSTWNHTDRMTTILHTCTMDVFGDGPQVGVIEPATAVMRRRNNGHSKKPSKSTGSL
jgi:transcriptional regulator with XRE-family HTH domain